MNEWITCTTKYLDSIKDQPVHCKFRTGLHVCIGADSLINSCIYLIVAYKEKIN